MNGPLWFAENGGGKVAINFRCRRTVYSGRSKHQSIDILDTEEFGRMLFLDGVSQSAERDEFIYHEAMVHPAMLTHPDPRRVCVIGGAEGATLREVFRHPGVERAVMVDIDDELVALCREHLAGWSAGAFDDPRLELHFGDGRRYLEQTGERFDVILVDLPDPVPDSPAVRLYSRQFYQRVADHLSPHGAACFQGGSLNPWSVELHARMFNTMSEVFPAVASYPYFQPCFHELHSQILASKKAHPRELDLAGRMEERGLDLCYLSPDYLSGLFLVPGYVEKAYQEHREILTDERPYRGAGRADKDLTAKIIESTENRI